ncbi:MAG TPA: DUF1634 domain-containing protein [Thermomicrobiales bacterium]|nr:DUF1634 domain-containing protein [Thermomicrobiales bacterium]
MSNVPLTADQTRPQTPGTGRSMEDTISIVLRIGVMIAGAVILLGLVCTFIPALDRGSGSTIHELLDNGGSQIDVSPATIAKGLGKFDPIAIIQFGLLLLVLTPIVRVAMTLFLFIERKETIFIAITTIVLFILLLGFLGII